MGDTGNDARTAVLASIDQVPDEIRAAWQRYLTEAVTDIWARPALSARHRSIATVAALATRGTAAELRHQILVALHNGLSRVELCEVMLQVTGYGGLGSGLDGMIALREVFDANPALGTDPGELEPPMPGDTRWDRSKASFTAVVPDVAEMLFDHIKPYEAETPAADRPPFDPDGSEWTAWIQGVSFGEFWPRGILPLAERELVTSSVIIVLGRYRELESHLKAAMLLGFSQQEMAEVIMQLAVYQGFPSAVEAMLQFQRALHGKDAMQVQEEKSS